MSDHNSFDGSLSTIGGHAFTATSRTLNLKEARVTPSFAKPVALYDKWHALPGTVPHYKHITPAFVSAEILPEMFVMDVLRGQNDDTGPSWDFCWRLFGTTHSDRYGKEATGVLMSEAAGRDESAASSYKVAQQVMKRLEAIFFLTEFIENNIAHKTTSTVAMPLSDSAGDVSRLFGCSIWSKF